MELILFGCVIALFVLYSRVRALEKRINELEPRTSSTEETTATLPVSDLPERQQAMLKDYALIEPQTPPQSFIPKQASTTPTSSVGDWLKEDLLVKLGALLLLLALGWFVSYAFANNWIGPAGRITLGLLLGIVFMVVGVGRIRTHVHQGSIFTVLGATTILLTIYAAREIYDFFTPASALIVMLASVIFVAFLSVRYQREQLAVAGLVLGALAPLFTAAPTPDALGLFMYLAVIVYGSLWVVFLTGWTSLTGVSLTMVFLYGLPFLFGMSSADKDIALAFALIFVGTFFITNVMSLIRRANEPLHRAHLFTAAGTALYLVCWIAGAVTDHWQSLLFVFWALVFGVGSYLVYTLTSNRIAFYIYASTGVALIGAATAAELSGPVLTIAFIIEIGVLIVIANTLRADKKLLRNLAWLYLIPAVLSLESLIASSWNTGIIHSDFIVILLMTMSFGVVGLFLLENVTADEDNKSQKNLATTLLVFSGCYAVALVWLSFHALFVDDIATLLALVLYTIVGLIFFIRGRLSENKALKTAGAVLIGLVVARLLLIEVWDMNLTGRIITFFVIGIMLISTAFIKKSK